MMQILRISHKNVYLNLSQLIPAFFARAVALCVTQRYAVEIFKPMEGTWIE